jgi:hypothetical protein
VLQSFDAAWRVSKGTVSRTGEHPLQGLRVLDLTAGLQLYSAAQFRIDVADDFLPRANAGSLFSCAYAKHRNPLSFAHVTLAGADRNFGSLP